MASPEFFKVFSVFFIIPHGYVGIFAYDIFEDSKFAKLKTIFFDQRILGNSSNIPLSGKCVDL